MKAARTVTVRVAASRVAKPALKAVAAVAKVEADAVAVAVASAPARVRANDWMPKAGRWHPKSAPMAHARRPTWQARTDRATNSVAIVHRAQSAATAVNADAANAPSKVNARPRRNAAKHVAKVAANAALIATGVWMRAHAPRQPRRRPVCRLTASRQLQLSRQQKPSASKVAANQERHGPMVRNRASAARVAAIVTVHRAANVPSAPKPASARSGSTCRSNR